MSRKDEEEMKVTDIMTITELSRITNKSRPTLYKYISDFELEKYDDIPVTLLELFKAIVNGTYTKKDVYSYCDMHFMANDELNDIFTLIKANRSRLDLRRLKEFIEKEIA